MLKVISIYMGHNLCSSRLADKLDMEVGTHLYVGNHFVGGRVAGLAGLPVKQACFLLVVLAKTIGSGGPTD